MAKRRPDDVPSWGMCWKETLRLYRWMIPVMYLMIAAMVHWLPAYMVTGGATPTPEQMKVIAPMSDWRAMLAMMIVLTFLLLVIIIGNVTGLHSAETPLEREERQLRELAALRKKYADPRYADRLRDIEAGGKVVDGTITVWEKGTSV